MIQPDLFSENQTAAVALARVSDPSTSKEAAAGIAVKLISCQRALLESFRRMQVYEEPTAGEAANNAYEHDQSSNAESYRKRCGELVRLGLIQESGKRKCRVTGNNARTFKVKP